MLDSDTKRRIDTARDILVGKVPDPKSQVEQITIALIYKFMDDMDAEAEELGGRRSFFAGAYARYGWAKLMRSGLGGHETLALYAEAITKMPENPGIPPLFRDIFKNAYLPYRDPETLRAFLKIIDEFSYDHSERLGDAFEYLLSVLGSQGDAGQFRTPRHIIDFMVGLIDPRKDETVLDPACGTAGFLISSFKHIQRKNRDAKGHSTLTPEDRARIAKNFKGYDISPDMVRLSLVNLYLHGFTDPHVYEYDTLTSEERWNEFADVILANPPFMSPKGGIKPHKRFSIQAKRSEVLFVDYMAEHLTPKGRAAIIVPEGIIFQSQTAYKDLRKMLVENSLVAVVSLPAGCFNPYSGVKTSILILDKTLAKQADTIAFFKVENDGFGLGAQRRAIEKNDLPQVKADLEIYLQTLREGRDLSPKGPADGGTKGGNRVKSGSQAVPPGPLGERSLPAFTTGLIVPKEKIAANGDYNLSGERYREGVVAVGNYPTRPLSELLEIQSGYPFKSDLFNEETGFPIIRIRDIKPNRTVTRYTGEYDPAFLVQNGDLLIGMDGEFNSVIWCGGPALLNQRVSKLHSFKGCLKEYVARLIPKKLKEIEDGTYAVTVKHISGKQIAGIEIPLPPLSVQQEIVAEIDGYQKVIDGARTVLDHYRPHIPIHPEWPMVELGEITKPEYGFTEKAAETGDARFIRITDISPDGTLRPEDPKFITLTKDAQASLLSKGDILVARTGATFGKTMIFEESYAAVFASFLIRLRFPKERVLPRYYWVFAQSDLYWNQANSLMTGGGQPQFNGNALVQVKIPLPPLATQQAIVAEIEAEQALVAGNRELIARFEKKIQATLARVWGEEVPKALDCGSPLPLSDPQPAAGVHEKTKEEPPDDPRRHVTAPRASRLAPEKRQQAAALHEEEEPSRPTHPDDLERSELMALFRDLLNRHGPTERQAVIRLAATELGYQRLIESVATSLDSALVTAVRRWVLINEGGVLRVFQNNIAEYDRKHLKSQLLAAVSENGRVWMEREDAIRAFSRWLGFRRAGPKINDTARSLINGLIRGGQLESSGNAIRRL